jgi:hypothetical protein
MRQRVSRGSRSQLLGARSSLGGRLWVEELESRCLLTGPTVSAILFSNPAGMYTNASSVTFGVNFSESVTGVAASDFVLNGSGPLAATMPVTVSGSGASYDVTVSDIHGNGTLGLELTSNNQIQDSSNNPLSGSFVGPSYTIYQADPYVVSINGTDPAGLVTNGASSVNYTVTFSQPVTGVADSVFQLTTTGGVAASTPVAVSGSGAVYSVSVSGITGIGTLGLNLVDNGTIHDLAGNPLVQANSPVSLANEQTFDTGTEPLSAAVADVNGDGKPDLIVGNLFSASVGCSRATATAPSGASKPLPPEVARLPWRWPTSTVTASLTSSPPLRIVPA